jgi:predicted AAA+ superfamily ATPase
MDYQVDKGHLLENLIFLQLRRNYNEIHYLKTIQEVDFCFRSTGILQLINVAFDISEKDTYEREISGLMEAMKHLQIIESTLIIGDGNRHIVSINNCQINIIPAWQWLLENS